MRVLTYVIAFLGAIWLFSSIAATKAHEAYRKGYRDGFNSLAIDSQCSAWLMNSDLKEAKSRICGK
jgi:hypothetical protein